MFELLDAYPWSVPLVIFFSRICDVSLGTLRIVLVSKGEKKIAPVVAFVELFIWIVVIAQVLSRANDIYSYIAYAGGYAAGTLIGLHMEEKIGFGFIVIRVFTLAHGGELVRLLHRKGYGSTVMQGEGSSSAIDIVEAVVNRKDTKAVEQLIIQYDPQAFYVIEDVRSKKRGIFAKPRPSALLK